MTKIGQAAWLCGSLPLGCIITYLEKFLFNSLIYSDAVPFRETVVWAQPLVIYIRYTQAKWVVGHVWLSYKMFFLNSSVSFLEYTDRKVVPYLVIVGNQISNKCSRFMIVYYICGTWDANVPLDCYLLDLDIIIISKEIWYKDYHFFKRVFEN